MTVSDVDIWGLPASAAPREIPQATAARLQLAAVAGNEPTTSFYEIRGKRPGGMHQVFVPVNDIERATRTILKWAALSDTYIGIAPRVRENGGAAAVQRVWTLWADIDGREALRRLADFRPLPSIVVRSGSIDSAHAYWPLRTPLSGAEAQAANRRLAHHLSADLKSTDAARILRPIGSRNYKHQPSREVVCTRLELDVFDIEQVLASVPELPEPERAAHRDRRRLLDEHDVLNTITPIEYVEMLTGRTVGRDGKICCPFHPDRTPSLHVYATVEQGWTCFGCGKGGTIVDFGALLYGISPRGEGFHEIRRRLASELLAAAVAA